MLLPSGAVNERSFPVVFTLSRGLALTFNVTGTVMGAEVPDWIEIVPVQVFGAAIPAVMGVAMILVGVVVFGAVTLSQEPPHVVLGNVGGLIGSGAPVLSTVKNWPPGCWPVVVW